MSSPDVVIEYYNPDALEDRCPDCPDVNPDPPDCSDCQYFEIDAGKAICTWGRRDGSEKQPRHLREEQAHDGDGDDDFTRRLKKAVERNEPALRLLSGLPPKESPDNEA